MSCYLCGHEETHHLGCARIANPVLTPAQAVQLGLLPAPVEEKVVPEVVEVLKPGTMTTEPQDPKQEPDLRTVGQCEFEGCDNPKYSDHYRVKFCEGHRDPKNRKE